MSYPIRIWSTAYSSVTQAEESTIQVQKELWQKLLQQDSKRKFLKIEHPEGLKDWFAPLGHPVSQDMQEEGDHYNIYMPLWMLDAGHLKGEGEESVLVAMDEEYFPEASRIKLRVIDSAFYNSDVKEELERALSSLGVIQEHTTLQIPVAALGGYKVEVFVSETEPANVVLCHGEEVALEFEEPIDQIEAPRPSTSAPADEAQTFLPTQFISTTTGFQAFQGAGNTLGTSNASIPDWRRDLPPPKRR